MNGFRTEQLTLAVYCYFLHSLYKDREAIQMPKLLYQKRVKHLSYVLFIPCFVQLLIITSFTIASTLFFASYIT